jgi:hypothetical protein
MKIIVVLCLTLTVSLAYPDGRDVSEFRSLLERILYNQRENDLVEREGDTPPAGSEDAGEPKEGREVSSNEDNSVELDRRGNIESIDELTLYKADGSTFKVSIKDMCLSAHNYMRNLHGAGDLKWSQSIADESAAYALKLAELGKLEHDTTPYGENLYSGSNAIGLAVAIPHAVKAWYTESYKPSNYNYKSNAFDHGRGHFTQAVWNKSTKVGCGVATRVQAQGGFTFTTSYVVARYDPPGNMEGQFVDNVKPLKNGKSSIPDVPLAALTPGNEKCCDYGPKSACKQSWCSIIKDICECTCA